MVTTQTGFTVVRENLEKGLFFGKKIRENLEKSRKTEKNPSKVREKSGKKFDWRPF